MSMKVQAVADAVNLMAATSMIAVEYLTRCWRSWIAGSDPPQGPSAGTGRENCATGLESINLRGVFRFPVDRLCPDDPAFACQMHR